MQHDVVLTQVVAAASSDPNVLGVLVFGSVARQTHHENSDIDILTILRASSPTSGINNTLVDGIKVGTVFLTRDVLIHGVETVPYLLHPLVVARLLFDREGDLRPLFGKIRAFFADHPEIAGEWSEYYRSFENDKARFGHEKTTIVEVWNEFEMRYSGGKIRRRFLTNL